ncbi:FtsX-like permease family protein [bacterium]|nr:FtsX-like permease family protein [bacterium]
MRFSSILKISYKNLAVFKMRSLVTLGGMTVGIAAIIFLVSLGYGLQFLVKKELATLEDLKTIDVFPGGSALPLSVDNLKEIEKMDAVENVYPVVDIASRLKHNHSLVEALAHSVKYDYLKTQKITNEEKEWGRREIIVTKAVSNLFGKSPGEMIGQEVELQMVLSADLLGNDASKKTISGEKFKIKEVLTNEEQRAEFYLPIDFLWDKGLQNHTLAKVIVSDVRKINSLRKQIEAMGLKTDYVGDTLAQVDRTFQLFRIFLGVFGGVALVVAALGMFNTLTVSLLERIREVGLMKALGMRAKEVGGLFVTEGIILGVSGGVIGVVLGVVLGKILNLIVGLWGRGEMGNIVNFFATPWYFAFFVVGVSLVISLFAAIYPARRAIKIRALDALRFE